MTSIFSAFTGDPSTVLCAALFAIGLYGVLTRRDLVGVLASIEIMLGAANIQLVAFGVLEGARPGFEAAPVVAESVGLAFVVLAAAEAAVGLALLLSLYRRSARSRVDELTELEG